MSVELMSKIFSQYWPMFLRGAAATLMISLTATILGCLIGLLIGVVRTTPTPERGAKRGILRALNGIFSVYIEFFRGTPMIVQAMVIFYGSAQAFDIQMDRFAAAILIVAINTGAYMAEIVRGGIISVEQGQYEAAQAIGMNHMQTMLYVILPQAIRNILPATGNEFVINIKDTSVLSVISVTELFFQTKSIAGITYKYFEPFIVASLIYLAMTYSVTRILRMIERKLDGPATFIMAGNQMQVQRPEDLARAQNEGGSSI